MLSEALGAEGVFLKSSLKDPMIQDLSPLGGAFGTVWPWTLGFRAPFCGSEQGAVTSDKIILVLK